MKKTVLYSLLGMLLALSTIQAAVAAGEVEYVLEAEATSVTPVFMDGHDGDLTKIKGFRVTGNLFLGGSPVGAFTADLIALHPPISVTAPYQHGLFMAVYDLPGIGSVEVTSQMVWLNSSTTASAGDVVASWSGSISNGTGALANAYGLSAGAGIVNISTGQAEITEIFRIRFSGF